MRDDLDQRAISDRRSRLWMIAWLSIFLGVAALVVMRVLTGVHAT